MITNRVSAGQFRSILCNVRNPKDWKVEQTAFELPAQFLVRQTPRIHLAFELVTIPKVLLDEC
jgi:hypothetical protein